MNLEKIAMEIMQKLDHREDKREKNISRASVRYRTTSRSLTYSVTIVPKGEVVEWKNTFLKK